MIRHNVEDRRIDWTGPRETTGRIGADRVSDGDIGRDVIYHAHDGHLEAGTVSSVVADIAFVRFHRGDTAAACDPSQLEFCVPDVWPKVPNRHLEASCFMVKGQWYAYGVVPGTGEDLTVYADTLAELHTLAYGRAYPMRIATVGRLP